MHSIKVQASFSAAHNLRGYRGKCEELHGHNWKVEVTVASDALDKSGMVLDFRILKKRLKGILEEMDHEYLNNLAFFRKTNPTSENIAKFIYDRLKNKLVGVTSVTVWENETSCATYEE